MRFVDHMHVFGHGHVVVVSKLDFVFVFWCSNGCAVHTLKVSQPEHSRAPSGNSVNLP